MVAIDKIGKKGFGNGFLSGQRRCDKPCAFEGEAIAMVLTSV